MLPLVAVIQTARLYPQQIGKVYAAKNGIIGALNEELIDTSLERDEDIAKLMQTPSGAFGSCRYKLKNNDDEYQRLIEVFKAHNIGYFFYNGGGDSQDTAHKVSQLGETMGYPITCIGIPKTVDNDLPFTDAVQDLVLLQNTLPFPPKKQVLTWLQWQLLLPKYLFLKLWVDMQDGLLLQVDLASQTAG